AGVALVAFAYAYKTGLVYALAIITLSIHYRYRRLSPKMLAVAIGAFVLVIFSVVNAERAVLNENKPSYEGGLGRLQAGTIGTASYLVSGLHEYLDAGVGGLAERSDGVDSLALIEKYTPRLRPYQWGKTYVALPAEAYLPRAIWHSKPVPFASSFGNVYGG